MGAAVGFDVTGPSSSFNGTGAAVGFDVSGAAVGFDVAGAAVGFAEVGADVGSVFSTAVGTSSTSIGTFAAPKVLSLGGSHVVPPIWRCNEKLFGSLPFSDTPISDS